MPRKSIRSFDVQWLQILDEHGECDEQLRPQLTDREIQKLYEFMILVRTVDERAFKLQREGRLRTYPPVLGQEASQVGCAFALGPRDRMFPSYRETGVSIVRGLSLTMIFQYWSGDERGNKIPEGLDDFPVTVAVGTQIPIAVGSAWAAKAMGEPIATLACFGDGATSKGDFHEGLNFAGVFSLPVVFLCQNNQWAISVPLHRQTASETIAQKAIAYGIEGLQVDGNDVFAVFKATREALDRAKAGEGPTLIECVTYRMGDHTTADDASRYRRTEDVRAWRARDPIDRLRRYMERKGMWDRSYGERVVSEALSRVDEAVKEFEMITPPNPSDIFLSTFGEIPPGLSRQMEEFFKTTGGLFGS